MKIAVSPANGAITPSVRAADSSRRRLVVPAATRRPPPALAALSAAAASGVIRPHSACMRWASVSSDLTGRKVPAPTCSVRRTTRTPAASMAATRPGVKCRPAVGAATAPAWAANSVW